MLNSSATMSAAFTTMSAVFATMLPSRGAMFDRGHAV
jgi:hypothetical protein